MHALQMIGYSVLGTNNSKFGKIRKKFIMKIYFKDKRHGSRKVYLDHRTLQLYMVVMLASNVRR